MVFPKPATKNVSAGKKKQLKRRLNKINPTSHLLYFDKHKKDSELVPVQQPPECHSPCVAPESKGVNKRNVGTRSCRMSVATFIQCLQRKWSQNVCVCVRACPFYTSSPPSLSQSSFFQTRLQYLVRCGYYCGAAGK